MNSLKKKLTVLLKIIVFGRRSYLFHKQNYTFLIPDTIQATPATKLNINITTVRNTFY